MRPVNLQLDNVRKEMAEVVSRWGYSAPLEALADVLAAYANVVDGGSQDDLVNMANEVEYECRQLADFADQLDAEISALSDYREEDRDEESC